MYGRSYREHVTFRPLRGTKRTASLAYLYPSKGDRRIRRPKRRSCPPRPNLWIADPSSARKGRISSSFRNWMGNGTRLRSFAQRIDCSAWLPPILRLAPYPAEDGIIAAHIPSPFGFPLRVMIFPASTETTPLPPLVRYPAEAFPKQVLPILFVRCPFAPSGRAADGDTSLSVRSFVPGWVVHGFVFLLIHDPFYPVGLGSIVFHQTMRWERQLCPAPFGWVRS